WACAACAPSPRGPWPAPASSPAAVPRRQPRPRVGARPLVFVPAGIARVLNLVVLVGGPGVLRGLAGLGLVGALTQPAPVEDAASHDGLLSVRGGNGTCAPGRGAAFTEGSNSGKPEGASGHGRRLRACEDQGSSCSARLMTADPVRGEEWHQV